MLPEEEVVRMEGWADPRWLSHRKDRSRVRGNKAKRYARSMDPRVALVMRLSAQPSGYSTVMLDCSRTLRR